MTEQPQDPAEQRAAEDFDAEATQVAKKMVDKAKPPKTKQQVIDQVGRITSKLADRADRLEDVQKKYVPVRHNGNVTAPVFENIGQEVREGKVGDTRISTDRLNGRTTVTTETINAEGRPIRHGAKVSKKERDDYGYKANPDGYQRFGTESKDTKTLDSQSVTGRTREKGKDLLEPDWLYDEKDDEIYTYTEDLGYRSDADMLLGTKNRDKDTPQELIDRAVSQSAETLGSIRGTIAAAEKAQKAAQPPSPEEPQPPTQNAA